MIVPTWYYRCTVDNDNHLLQKPRDAVFAYLDVETTGLDPVNGDRICEVAVVKTKNGAIIDSYETLVNPGIPIPTGATSVNGITDQMVLKSPFFRNIARELLAFIDSSVIVAHNAKFDLSFLRTELSSLRLNLPDQHVIDTLQIARRYYNFPSNNLGQIARFIGIPIETEHRALADVMITRDLMEFYIRDLTKRGIRLKKLKDIIKLQGQSVELEEDKGLVLPPTIEEALRNRDKLQIKYLSAYGEDTTTRVIEPLEISVSRNNTYIHAYCHLRKERCTFRLDRILEVKNLVP